ncbi:MAG: hypothetical protein KC482_04190 [Dehalococcoidia bacterium]|nr:hypothetical protein [Dehalococcoidia bacterium]MCA9826293.1 hypothetical protein [Dehalococcoidia bacterium]MCA9845609.1 hypothetical protein [Dehalococcoidia bacterium]MCA9852783.1 hypothetical protein [Dehalococcoidia bacterium]
MAVDGTYNVTMKTPMGDRPATLNLSAAGDALSGSFSSERGDVAIQDGSASGDDIKFSMMFAGPMGEMKLDFAGKVDGDKIGGSVQFGAFGSGTWEGTRA